MQPTKIPKHTSKADRMTQPRDLKKIAKGLHAISRQSKQLALFIDFTLREAKNEKTK